MMVKAQVRKNGGSLYVKIDPYLVKQGRVRAGDWVDYEIKAIEPAISIDGRAGIRTPVLYISDTEELALIYEDAGDTEEFR